MDISKMIGGKADKVIDQAADFAKDKLEQVFEGGQAPAKDKGQKGGIGDLVTGAITKAAADQAADSAADQAVAFGKKLFQ